MAWKGQPEDVIAVYLKSMKTVVTLPKYLDVRERWENLAGLYR